MIRHFMAALVASALLSSPALADRFDKSRLQGPVNDTEIATNPNELPPLPQLPNLESGEWTNWMMPVPQPVGNRFRSRLHIINLSAAPTETNLECYDYRGMQGPLGGVARPNGSVNFHDVFNIADAGIYIMEPPSNTSWCRISASAPVLVYLQQGIRVRTADRPDEQTQVIYGKPYPTH